GAPLGGDGADARPPPGEVDRGAGDTFGGDDHRHDRAADGGFQGVLRRDGLRDRRHQVQPEYATAHARKGEVRSTPPAAVPNPPAGGGVLGLALTKQRRSIGLLVDSGRSSVWLERTVRDREVGSSNLL